MVGLPILYPHHINSVNPNGPTYIVELIDTRLHHNVLEKFYSTILTIFPGPRIIIGFRKIESAQTSSK